jgi:hypothetical protein
MWIQEQTVNEATKLANQAAIAALQTVGGPAAVQQLAMDLGGRAVDGAFWLIDRHIDWKRHSPCAAAEFHRVMHETMPRIRWIAKLHHRRLHRRWRARCRSTGCGHACK